jgi:hypothetical protein
MSYQVDKFNGQLLTTVEDGTIDTTTDLRFVGKNYAGYGEVQNENFLHLLENFANTTAPPKSIIGQVWYDTSSKKLKFYDGSKYKWANGAEVSDTAPAGLVEGEFWWNQTTKQLYAYSNGDYVLVGPESAPALGESLVSSITVTDTDEGTHQILKIIAGGTCVAVVNQDNEFSLTNAEQLRAQLPQSKFSKIKKGITLVDTDIDGVGQNGTVVWGTASNALSLGGVPASEYVRTGRSTFNEFVRFYDPGFGVGGAVPADTPDIKVYIDPIAGALIQNQIGEAITVRISVPTPTTTINNDVAIFDTNGISPGGTDFSLGTNLNRWANIYSTTVTATSFVGNHIGQTTGTHIGNVTAVGDSQVLINATTKEIGYDNAVLRGTLFGNVEGNVRGTADDATALGGKIASITATPDTIARRDLSANITANRFIGIADSANQLLVGASYRSTSLAADGNTVAARTSDGDIFARLFVGTATAARYADLAEKYLTDKDYEPGTVVTIGGDAEVTSCKLGDRALGVVSTAPAYMMNSELDGGTYIALKGRVPCKVGGAVKKGDRLVAGNNGYAVLAGPGNRTDVFGIALETCDGAGINIIEVVVL